MRDYIQQHIKQPVAAYIHAIYEAAVKDYDDHPFVYSSVHGNVTDRSMIKDSYVFGDVMMKGDCKMLGCVVAPDTTVIMEPGAVAVNCMLGEHRKDAMPRLIHIGKNSVISWAQIDINLKLGSDSCIYGSGLFCEPSYENHTPNVTIGNGSLLTNAAIRIYRPRARFFSSIATSVEMDTPTLRLGNRAVIIRSEVSISDITVETGDDVLIGGYAELLQTCLGELADVTKVPAAHPAGRGFNIPDSVLCSLVPEFMLIDDMTIGSRVTLMASMECHNSNYAAVKNKVEIGDDVIVGIDQFVETKDYIEELSYGLRMVTGDVILDNGSTLVLSGRAKGEPRVQGKLHVGEGAIAVLEQKRPTDDTTNPVELNIMPYTTVML